MSTVLFNFHDMVLLMTAGMSMMLACLLLVFHDSQKKASSYLLACFLLLYVVIPFDKLVTYGSQFRYIALNYSPNFLLVGNAALLLEGPMLLWYVNSVIQRRFEFSRYDWLHFLPLVLYAGFAYWVYFRHDPSTKYHLALTLKVFEHWSFKYFFSARDAIRVAYGVITLFMVVRYRTEIRQQFSEIQKIDMQWLLFVAIGFLFLRLWMFIESMYSASFVFIHGGKSQLYVELMGMSGLLVGYFNFFLIVMLIFFSLRYSLVLEGVEYIAKKDRRPVVVSADLATRIAEYMEKEKPHLEQNITIDDLSARLGVTPKTLSTLLNRHFKQSFFEYINAYRVEEAKRMLSSPEFNDISIVDILNNAGFSSKSAFNKFFKRIVGIAPREFRKQYENTPSATPDVAKLH